ncbi:hypothetical protein OQA88_9504 [Cercophora sp. LCS_1]
MFFVYLFVAGLAAASGLDTCNWKPVPLVLLCAADNESRPANSSGQSFAGHEARQYEQHHEAAAHDEPAPDVWTSTNDCFDQYCIHYNPGFGSVGMAAITTKSNLAILKSHHHPSLSAASSGHYHIAPIPGKGLGLIANTTLTRGTTIMSEVPALLIHRGFMESASTPVRNAIMDKAVSILPAPRRQAYLSQMAHFIGHKASSIFATNSFQMSLNPQDPSAFHYASYPPVSRFNHDCRPNVAFKMNGLSHTTTVVRDVKPGEELTITYLDSKDTRAKRRERAKLSWGFECGCSQCMLSDRANHESEKRLEEIKDIETKLADPMAKGVNAALLRRVLKLYKDERLEVDMAGVLALVAMNWNMIGNAKMAKRYAGLAKEAVFIESGEEADDYQSMGELEGDPKGHFTWNRLQRAIKAEYCAEGIEQVKGKKAVGDGHMWPIIAKLEEVAGCLANVGVTVNLIWMKRCTTTSHSLAHLLARGWQHHNADHERCAVTRLVDAEVKDAFKVAQAKFVAYAKEKALADKKRKRRVYDDDGDGDDGNGDGNVQGRPATKRQKRASANEEDDDQDEEEEHEDTAVLADR